MRIAELTTYQTGAHTSGEFEVMRNSTAELFSNVPFKPRTRSVEIDGEINRLLVDTKGQLKTREDWVALRNFLALEVGK